MKYYYYNIVGENGDLNPSRKIMARINQSQTQVDLVSYNANQSFKYRHYKIENDIVFGAQCDKRICPDQILIDDYEITFNWLRANVKKGIPSKLSMTNNKKEFDITKKRDGWYLREDMNPKSKYYKAKIEAINHAFRIHNEFEDADKIEITMSKKIRLTKNLYRELWPIQEHVQRIAKLDYV